MVWHIKKTSFVGTNTVYYMGENKWTALYEDRILYSSQAKAKAENYIWDKKKVSNWDVTAVNEG